MQGKVGAAPTQDVAAPHLEMSATTHPRELVQGTTRVVPYRELALNITIMSADIKTRLMHRRTDANLYQPERQLTKASEPSFNLEDGAKGQI